ncbi:MAG: phosphoribosylformylglycinamidine synthase subunit PurL [Candidatus Cloacimonetes bacterium]|nr:phosphoribosylformylglycinamidine synthase subunit PurL [Candidatus Cloacimonadota bacterium]
MEIKVTPELIEAHGISPEEYEMILEILGREPNYVELGIFSVMYSEHASYKNSILQLKTLPRDGKALLAKAGDENAGVVDIGGGLAVCFKIESHNHPSAVEPYHGAATGLGGILRDIFTMGAKPIAAVASLFFGNTSKDRNRFLMDEALRGISDYGNTFEVPTVGAELFFDDAYDGNPLVNAMAVGLVEHDKLARSAASGVGNVVVYAGAKTGREGIHGATFASVDLEEDAEMPSNVQVGDPEMGKRLAEATLEAINTGLVVAIQDMGAAGLTCSSSEMAGKAGLGIQLDLEKIPLKDADLEPWEIMLSETQERMLLVVEPKNLDTVLELFRSKGLEAVAAGSVTDDGFLAVRKNGELLAQIPAEALILGGGAPVYSPAQKEPEKLAEFSTSEIFIPGHGEMLLRLLAEPNIASKTALLAGFNPPPQDGAPAALVPIPAINKSIALSTACNPRHCELDPFEGAKAAVAEAARKIACTGAKPIAISNCLNFGSPKRPEVFWSFAQAIRGMGDACRAFETPVTGGNVSFYNENPHGAILPSPVIAMLGILENPSQACPPWFQNGGDQIALLGEACSTLGGSQYLHSLSGELAAPAPQLDLEKEKNLLLLLNALVEKDLLASARPVSQGGLLPCLAQACFNPEKTLGAKLDFELQHEAEAEYFGESHSRAAISFKTEKLEEIRRLCAEYQTPITLLGKVNDDTIFEVNQHINEKTEHLLQVFSAGI